MGCDGKRQKAWKYRYLPFLPPAGEIPSKAIMENIDLCANDSKNEEGIINEGCRSRAQHHDSSQHRADVPRHGCLPQQSVDGVKVLDEEEKEVGI